MKILIIGTTLRTSWTGGEPVAAFGLAKGLRERGEHVMLEATTPQSLELISLVGTPVDADPLRFQKYRHLLQKVRPDVVLAFYDYDCSAILAASRAGIPVIACAQIYWPLCPIGTLYRDHIGACTGPSARKCILHILQDTPPPNITKSFSRFPPIAAPIIYGKFMSRYRLIRNADATVVPSVSMAATLRSYHLPCVYSVPNGVDTHFFSPRPGKGGPPTILYPMARSGLERKGFHHFRQMAIVLKARHPEWRFIALSYAGDGVVEGMPYLSRSAMVDMIGTAHFVVVPVLWEEPFGLVVAEALSCGRAVVAYASGGITEVLQGNDCGVLVTKGDVDALTHSVEALAEDPARNQRLNSNARRVVEAEFTYRHMAEGYLRVIREVLSRRGG